MPSEFVLNPHVSVWGSGPFGRLGRTSQKGGLCYTKGTRSRFTLCSMSGWRTPLLWKIPYPRCHPGNKKLPDQVLAGFPASVIGRNKFLFFRSYSIPGALPQQHRQTNARYFQVKLACDSLGRVAFP